MTGRAEVTRAVLACDYFRRSPWRLGGERGHKEWLHFCVSDPAFELLVNLSVMDDLRESAAGGDEVARASVLAHEEGWSGAVELYSGTDVRVGGGEIAADIGPNQIRFVDGAYVLRVRAPRARVAADLRLVPVTYPSLVNNVRGLDGRPIHWAVVPRSIVTGAVRIGGRVHELSGALAYHDHNWGSFAWGNNFAWEWGYGLPSSPAEPWSLVFARLNSRGNTAALMQLFFVWREGRLLRTFRDHDIEVRREGLLRPRALLRLPPVMGLLAPGTATDIPRRLLIRAAARGDVIEAVFEPRDVAQVILPNDEEEGVTVINEVNGALSVEGRIGGERVAMANRSTFEILSA